MQPAISFRPLQQNDFELMHRWLNMPHVRQWWDKAGASLDEVERKYAPRVAGTIPVSCFIIEIDCRPIGYIQAYWLRDFPENSACALAEPSERSASLDVFVGEPELLNSGIGSAVVRMFLNDVVFGRMKAERCFVAPSQNNHAAVAAYHKVGFQNSTTIQSADCTEAEILMWCQNSAQID